MHKINEFHKRLIISIVLLAIAFGSIIYAGSLLLFEFRKLEEVLAGIIFLCLFVINLFFTIIGAYYFTISAKTSLARPSQLPKIIPSMAVLVPVRNEGKKIFLNSASSLKKLVYPKDKLRIIIVDNNDKMDNFVQKTVQELGFEYKYVQNPVKFKSHALNQVVLGLNEKYFAVFDADEQIIDGNILLDCLTLLEEDKNVSFVQTCKKYAEKNLFSSAINSYYLYFYNHMQTVRDTIKSPACCGSCVVIRTETLKQLKGFNNTPTEDLEFSFRADIAGFDGRYIHRVYALGQPIESFSSFINQQFRYAYGLSRITKDYFLNFFKLDKKKRIHYIPQIFGYHFLAFPALLFSFLTIFFVYLNFDIFALTIIPLTFFPQTYTALFAKIAAITYFLVFMATLVQVSKMQFGSYKIGGLILFLNFAAMIPRIKAIILGTLKINLVHRHTRESLMPKDMFSAVLSAKYELLILAIIVCTTIIAFYAGMIVILFWLAWYIAIFSSRMLFLYFVDLKQTKMTKTSLAGQQNLQES